MTRVSLKEAYDNKDVVAQIYAIRDIAEGAENTANNAVSTANTASEHVDALVPQVEGAVQNANNASASAQASAQTVTGYENRLSNVELKITTVEGDIVTIQGRITALETADGQNVKLTGEHAIGNYAVLLTGNQDITGIKYMLNGPKGKDNRYDVTVAPSNIEHFGSGFTVYDKNNVSVCGIYPQLWTDGTIHVFLTIRNKDGTTKYVPLGVGD